MATPPDAGLEASRSPPQVRQQRRRSLSIPRHGRRHEVVVQRVVKDVGGTPCPQLTCSNYEDWSLLMKVKMEARGLWDSVEYGDAGQQDDRMAVDAILSAVPLEMIRSLATKKAAKEAWEAIQSLHVSPTHSRKSTLQRLRREWELLSFHDGEHVDEFTLRLTGMMSSLTIHGKTIDEQEAVEKLLHVVPDKYTQLALSIEMLLDTTDTSIEEVIGRPSLTWCAGCPSSRTSTSSAPSASRQSRSVLPSPRRPSTARNAHSSWSMVTSVTPSHRRYLEDAATSSCSWMITPALCGWS
jgi:hypothetical protein